MSDFLKCPRLYYLHNVYKDPKTGRKMSIVTPHMSLGIAVHNVLENLGNYPAHERMQRDLRADFEAEWLKVSGIKGGFLTPEQEEEFKSRGKEMINNVIRDPKFLVNKRVKLPKEKMNPNFWLYDPNEEPHSARGSDGAGIILNGQVDWIEYLDLPAQAGPTLHIVDFKTGKHEEKDGSLQLPIYLLLCNALRPQWKVSKASYWYLESDKIVPKELPDMETSRRDVLDVALKVKAARVAGDFHCPKGDYDPETSEGGCSCCRPYEHILEFKAGKAVKTSSGDDSVISVGIGGFNQDIFVVK